MEDPLSDPSEGTCRICLDPENDMVTQRKTLHVCECPAKVHEECITEWLIRSEKWWCKKRPIVCEICLSPYLLDIPVEETSSLHSQDALLNSANETSRFSLNIASLLYSWIGLICILLSLVLILILIICLAAFII
jgi:E3 ubiquitin-protein ligase DOA10